jgi:pimeloyl-ACP methyl ester carboxylesterase
MDAIAVSRQGKGPEVLLVHGGASPSTTWGALAPLRARWTLALVHRRGYPPSPSPPDGRQDFEVDAADLASLLDARPHVVAHSYGALGTLIAATRMPARVRSLTLIEPPLYHLVPRDTEVARLERMGAAVLTNGLDTDPATLREFLRLAGAPEVADGPLPRGGCPRCSPRAPRPPPRRRASRPRGPTRRPRPIARGLRRSRARTRADLRRPRGHIGCPARGPAWRRALRRGDARFHRAARAVLGLGGLSPPSGPDRDCHEQRVAEAPRGRDADAPAGSGSVSPDDFRSSSSRPCRDDCSSANAV